MKKWAAVAICVLAITACEKDQLDPISMNQGKSIDDYPATITMDNWEAFIYAPQAVIDHHIGLDRLNMQERESWPVQAQMRELDSRGSQITGMILRYISSINAWISFSGVDVSNNSSSDVTDSNGRYTLSNDGSQVCASYPTPANNSVSGMDLILLRRHVLAIAPFTKLREYLAADVNRDGKVTTLDAIYIQQVILGTSSSFSNSENVLFVDGPTYQSADANLGGLTQQTLQSLGTNTNCQTQNSSFAFRVSIKTGDISGEF